MAHDVDARGHEQARSVRARALAALHRVERDGGVHAKRERLVKVGVVHDAKVKAMRHAM